MNLWLYYKTSHGDFSAGDDLFEMLLLLKTNIYPTNDLDIRWHFFSFF